MKKFLNKSVKLMIIALGLEYFACGFSDFFFSIFINNIVENLFYVGVLFALSYLANLLSVIVLSKLLDDSSARDLAMAGKLVNCLTAILLFAAGVYHSAFALFVAAVFFGISRAVRNVSEQDFLIEHSDKKNASKILGVNFATEQSLWLIATALGGFILLFLSQKFGKESVDILHYSYLIIIPFSIIGFFFLSWIPEQKMHFSFRKLENIAFSKKTFSTFLNGMDKIKIPLLFGIVMTFMLNLLRNMILLFVPLLAISLNLEFWQIGILVASLWTPFLLTFVFSFLADKFDRLNIILFGLIFSLLPLILLAFVQAPLWIAVLSSALSLTISLLQPANLGIIASLAPEKEKAHIAGLELFFGQMGNIFGALVLGWVAQKFGLQTVFLIIAIIAFLFAVFAMVVKKGIQDEHAHLHNKKAVYQSHHHVVHQAHAH